MSHPSSSLLDPSLTFPSLLESIGLDPRLRRAVSRLGHERPTLVQSRCLPLAVRDGRDLLVRARTGSGKTLAYCLPVLHRVLTGGGRGDGGVGDGGGIGDEGGGDDGGFVRAVILTPTRELCSQVHRTLVDLTYYCDEVVSVAVLGGVGVGGGGKGKKDTKAALARQEAMLRDRPSVVVSTPAGLLAHVRSGALVLRRSVECLVVDEADLVLSFGYADDIAEIMKSLPKICQGFLMSATLSPEIGSLKRVVLHSPAVLKLEEEDESARSGEGGSLSQFYLRLPKKDKYLVLYVFLKLGLLRGKGLFFVNTTDGGYRLKLFLEQFHIRAAVLNAELPLRSRLSVIEQYNVGNFEYLIATDESTDAGTENLEAGGDDYGDSDDERRGPKKRRRWKGRGGRKKDGEYGVSRGLDFRGVSFVVNVDFPASAKSYTHRIGRTARGGASGVALSLVEAESGEQSEMLERVREAQPLLPAGAAGGGGTDDGLRTSSAPIAGGAESDPADADAARRRPLPLDFDLSEIEGFRYRAEDVGRAVTRAAVREARASELRAEVLNSERLRGHFEENPDDLRLLRHDRVATRAGRVQDHLKHVPKYMLPRGMSAAPAAPRRKRRRRKGNVPKGGTESDPLRSYEGGDVTLDGVAGEGEGEGGDGGGGGGGDDGDGDGEVAEDAEFFEVDGDDDDDNDDDGEDGAEGRKSGSRPGRVFLSTTDGTGRRTSGTRAWQARHGKGEFRRGRRRDRRGRTGGR